MRSNELKNSELTTVKTAFFLDFDNFFGGLMSADPTAALALVTSPSQWLHKLLTSYTDGADRRWLVLRCYMNPAGWLPDPRNVGERLYFSKFRPFFTQAGVEVVDCPALTKASKNGADIRIVIDVMTALRSNVKYEEFVIASADADFTPLLQVLRAEDRKITVIATSSTAVAYESLADRFLDEQNIFELMAPVSQGDTEFDSNTAATELGVLPSKMTPLEKSMTVGSQYEEFSTAVRDIYSESKMPINLARLASDLKTASGIGAIDGKWFGAGSFVRALQVLGLPNAQFSQHHLWDPTRHHEPAASPAVVNTGDLPHSVPSNMIPSVPATVMHFAEVTGMPRIPSKDWPFVYQTLADYAALHIFNFTESTKWSRDQAAVDGRRISREAFAFVIRASRGGGADLNSDPSPDAADINRALFMSVLRQAELAGLEVDESEKQELASWLHCEDSEN